MTIEDPGGLRHGNRRNPRPSQAQKGFVLYLRPLNKGGRRAVLFRLSNLQEGEPPVPYEINCSPGWKSDRQAACEGFHLLRQDLLQRKNAVDEGANPWLHRRLQEMLDSLESEKSRILGEDFDHPD